MLITDPAIPDLVSRVREAVAAFPGCLVQLRWKGAEGRAVHALAEALRPIAPLLVVNDRVDVALAVGADGVHLPERGLPIAEARSLLPGGALVGVSRHAPGPAEGADYVALAPIFPTPGKGPPLGVGALAFDCGTPVFALGGVRRENAAACLAAGAYGVAMIRGVLESTDPGRAAAELRSVLPLPRAD